VNSKRETGIAQPPLVAIRVDSGHKIGSGHIHRCLFVGIFLRNNGFNPIFICRNFPGSIWHEIKQNGFEYVLLPSDERFAFSVFSSTFSVEDYENMALDADECADVFAQHYAGQKIAWAITDHMLIRKPWQTRFSSKMNCKLLAIDGQANVAHHADVLLDPQIHENPTEKWDGLLPSFCTIFNGPTCLPLSPAFESARNKAQVRTGILNKVLVCFGGTDFNDLVYRTTSAMISWLRQAASKKINIDIAVPAHLQSVNRLEELVAVDSRFQLHVGVNDLSPFMVAADLAIGGGGIMLWERCLLGLPAIVVPLSENQKKPIELLESKGAVISVTSPDQGYEASFGKALTDIYQKPGILSNMSSAAFDIMSDSPRTNDWLNVMKGCNDG